MDQVEDRISDLKLQVEEIENSKNKKIKNTWKNFMIWKGPNFQTIGRDEREKSEVNALDHIFTKIIEKYAEWRKYILKSMT